MRTVLKPNGELVTINNHNIHIYKQGNINCPKLIFMSGSGTVAPVYDFKVLYEKLQNDFRIIVIEKFGYGYSDIFEASCDIDSLVSMQKQALDIVGEEGKIDCPILLFCSNGKETSKNWVKSQQEFAAEMNAKLLCYNCGHYMHYDKSHEIAGEIKAFMKKVIEHEKEL